VHDSLASSPPYAVCFSGRVGSNHLCEQLLSLGCFGNPREYYNPALKPGLMADFGAVDEADYWRRIESKTRSAQGVWGLKVCHDAMLAIEAALGSVPPVRPIWLRRRDRLRQAISWYRARATRLWVDRGNASPVPIPAYDRRAIEHYLAEIERVDRFWQGRFSERPLELWYEELDVAIPLIARFLEVELPDHPPRSTTRVQRDVVTEEWVERFQAGR